MMKMLFALTAAAITAATFSVPASAGTIGCDQGEAMNASAKATNCRSWRPANLAANPSIAQTAFAQVGPARTVVAPSARYLPDLENEGGSTGVSGGAAD